MTRRSTKFPPARQARQRGSILVNVGVGLSVMIILLSVIDLGFLYYYKREYQKVADLAALAGAQVVREGCAAAQISANQNAQQNLAGRIATVAPVECGFWSPTTAPTFTSGTSQINAVRATILGGAPNFLPYIGARQLSASAVATVGDPMAAFSVGSRAVRVGGDSTLGAALEGLGLNLSGTSLVSYEGLAQVKITPGGLLAELGIPVSADIGVGELNALLAAEQVSLGSMLNAIATVAGQSSLASVNAALLSRVAANLVTATPLNLRLGSDNGVSGLFAEIIAPDNESASALKTQVGVLELITAAVGVASSGHALNTGINIPNLLGLVSVTTQAGVVEPPSIAIGGLGADGICNGNEVCPTAYTAQVRTFIHVKTTDALLGALLKNLLKLDLPIVLDAVTGKGTLQEMCTIGTRDTDGTARAEIEVESTVAKVCVGQIAAADLFSKSKVCDENLGNMELLNVAGLLRLPNNRINIDALEGGGTVTLKEGQTKTTGNELLIGNTVTNLVGQLTSQLFGGPVPSGSLSPGNITNLATQLYNETGTVGHSHYVCNANTATCRSQRLSAARTNSQAAATNSGLVSGLLTGLLDVVGDLLACTNGLTGTNSGCINRLESNLNHSSTSSSGGVVANGLGVLTGILKPVLNAVGSSVLTPLLNNVVGLHLGETDVKLTALSCGGNPKLVE
ncbi:MAG: TadG family pilus assembly protein [Panacagrimonas sp.]